jgi:hypothetical protein
VPYDGVVATPRIVDLRDLRSGSAAATTLPIACCKGRRVCNFVPSPIMAFGNGFGAMQLIQLRHVSSRAAGANLGDLGSVERNNIFIDFRQAEARWSPALSTARP